MDQFNPEKVFFFFFGHIQLLEVFICVTLKEPYSSSHILWKMSTLVTPNV